MGKKVTKTTVEMYDKNGKLLSKTVTTVEETTDYNSSVVRPYPWVTNYVNGGIVTN